MEYVLSEKSAEFLKTLMSAESKDTAAPQQQGKTLSRIAPIEITGDWEQDETERWVAKCRRLWLAEKGYELAEWNKEEYPIYAPTAKEGKPNAPTGHRGFAVFRGTWELITIGGGGGTRLDYGVVVEPIGGITPGQVQIEGETEPQYATCYILNPGEVVEKDRKVYVALIRGVWHVLNANCPTEEEEVVE